MYILIEFRVYKTRDPCGIIEFPDKNRVLKTPFFCCRTRAYKTQDLCGITVPAQQVGIESLSLEFYMELESIKFEMLVCKILSNAC